MLYKHLVYFWCVSSRRVRKVRTSVHLSIISTCSRHERMESSSRVQILWIRIHIITILWLISTSRGQQNDLRSHLLFRGLGTVRSSPSKSPFLKSNFECQLQYFRRKKTVYLNSYRRKHTANHSYCNRSKGYFVNFIKQFCSRKIYLVQYWTRLLNRSLKRSSMILYIQ